MHERKKEETSLFYIGWAMVGFLLILYTLSKIFAFSPIKYATPCVAYTFFGFYCPGCGGTRAVSALFHGQLLDSFICHPLVPYTAIVCGWFLLSQTIERVSKHKIKIGMRYRNIYLWIALGIVVVNFIVKNIILRIWHIDILANYTL